MSRDRAQRDLARDLAEAGLPTPALDARLLLCSALGIDHTALVRDPGLPLGAAAAMRLAGYAARRLRREPVSRILGHREFWGLSLRVTPDVLDPRADSETLVVAALDALGPPRETHLRLLDLGTGSGALLCAMLHERRDAFGIGTDRSIAAAAVARENLRALGLADRGAIVVGDWGDAIGSGFDAVVSNPPYVAWTERASLESDVADYDPPLALYGGPDGLDAYRAIVPHLAGWLRPGGIAAFEIGPTQGEAVGALMRATGFTGIVVRSDLADRSRVVLGRATGQP